MKLLQDVRSEPARTRKQLAVLAAASGVLAATISFGAVASAAGTHAHGWGHGRRHVTVTHARRRVETMSHPSTSHPLTMATMAPASPRSKSTGPRGQVRRLVTMTSSRRPAAVTNQPPGTGTTPVTATPPPTPTPPPAPTPTPPPTPTPAPGGGAPLEGVYVGPANPSGVASFDATTGTHSSVASDYLPSSSGWSGMDGAGGGLSWLTGPWQNKGYTLSLGVPMIPESSSGAPVGTLATGATGAYNSYFISLAQTLVAAGEGNAYLRLGWEFDGGWYAWSATTPATEASYAAYFDQIVTAMRSVSGENFRFVWNPDADAFTAYDYNVTLAYPGNAYVDVIGLDDYDQTWVTPQTPANEWNETSLPALSDAHSFAAAHGKPLAIPEWGLTIRSDGHGLGDDPLYINDFTSWMKNSSNDVLFESYFNFDPSGDNSQITDGDFPNALAAFETDLG
jgi:hypothetical protein